MTSDDWLLVGRVARAHGNRGEVIVNPETDFPEQRFRTGATLLVGDEAHGTPRAIRAVRFHQTRPVLALEGVDTMDDAERLAGAALSVRIAGLAPLPAGTFYRHDLVGCEVLDIDGRRIGGVVGVEGPMEQSRLIVEGPAGAEVLIPLVAEICQTVDPARRRIVVNPPEGLIELNDTARAAKR